MASVDQCKQVKVWCHGVKLSFLNIGERETVEGMRMEASSSRDHVKWLQGYRYLNLNLLIFFSRRDITSLSQDYTNLDDHISQPSVDRPGLNIPIFSLKSFQRVQTASFSRRLRKLHFWFGFMGRPPVKWTQWRNSKVCIKFILVVYMYKYTHIYTYIHPYIYIYTPIYIHIYTHIYIHIYTHIYTKHCSVY